MITMITNSWRAEHHVLNREGTAALCRKNLTPYEWPTYGPDGKNIGTTTAVYKVAGRDSARFTDSHRVTCLACTRKLGKILDAAYPEAHHLYGDVLARVALDKRAARKTEASHMANSDISYLVADEKTGITYAVLGTSMVGEGSGLHTRVHLRNLKNGDLTSLSTMTMQTLACGEFVALPVGDLAPVPPKVQPVATCGYTWVAEIGLCPRCGLDAVAHQGNTQSAALSACLDIESAHAEALTINPRARIGQAINACIDTDGCLDVQGHPGSCRILGPVAEFDTDGTDFPCCEANPVHLYNRKTGHAYLVLGSTNGNFVDLLWLRNLTTGVESSWLIGTMGRSPSWVAACSHGVPLGSTGMTVEQATAGVGSPLFDTLKRAASVTTSMVEDHIHQVAEMCGISDAECASAMVSVERAVHAVESTDRSLGRALYFLRELMNPMQDDLSVTARARAFLAEVDES